MTDSQRLATSRLLLRPIGADAFPRYGLAGLHAVVDTTNTASRRWRRPDLLVRATEETMRHLPGFISASIHRSLDGTKVINYAQWRSQADFAALKDNPKARPHMQAAAALASFEPIVCEVVDSIATDK